MLVHDCDGGPWVSSTVNLPRLHVPTYEWIPLTKVIQLYPTMWVLTLSSYESSSSGSVPFWSSYKAGFSVPLFRNGSPLTPTGSATFIV